MSPIARALLMLLLTIFCWEILKPHRLVSRHDKFVPVIERGSIFPPDESKEFSKLEFYNVDLI